MNILYFIIALLVLALMIFIHELGHYTAGRLLGFKILDFSIGFGPALFKFKKNDITYALRAIPLGGACRFYGEEDDPIDAVSFNSQKPWKRLIVIFAGPFMNFVLAYILAVVMMFSFGQTAYKTYDNGDIAVMINDLTADGAAQRAGIMAGDMLLKVNNSSIEDEPHDFEDKLNVVSDAISAAPSDGLTVTVKRGDERLEIFVSNIYNAEEGRNIIGIVMGGEQYFIPYGFFESFGEAGKTLIDIVKLTFEAIFNGLTKGFKDGDVSGIVGTVAITMKMASKGFYYLMFVMVLISMSLGIMNLLPILPMDGGHLLFDFIELVVGKPVPRKIQNVLSIIGIVLLIGLMVYATIGDIKGLANGLFNW